MKHSKGHYWPQHFLTHLRNIKKHSPVTSQGQEKMFILYNLNLKQKLRSWFSLETVIETSTTHTNLFLSWRHEIITPSTLISREFNTTHGTFHQCVWRREGLMRSLKPICPRTAPDESHPWVHEGSWDCEWIPAVFLMGSSSTLMPRAHVYNTHTHTHSHTHTLTAL